MTTVATTSWQSGPNEKMAVVDTYAAKGREVISSIQDFAKRNKEEIGAVVRGGKAAAEVFPIITGAVNGMKFNKDNMAARLLIGNSAIRSVLSRVSPEFKDKMINATGISGDTFAKMGDLVSRVATTDFKNLYDVGNLVNEYSKAAGFTELFSLDDQDSTVGFLAGTVMEATRYGIPNSFSSVMRAIENGPILSQVTRECLPTAIEFGDLHMINDMAKMCSNGQVLQMMPNAIDRIGSAYKGSINGTDIDAGKDFFLMNETFTSIDDLWDRGLRNQGKANEENIKNLTSLFDSSLEVQRSFRIGSKQSDNVDDKMNLLAFEYGRGNVTSDLKAQFPSTNITPKGEAPQADSRLLEGAFDGGVDIKNRPWYKELYGDGPGPADRNR